MLYAVLITWRLSVLPAAAWGKPAVTKRTTIEDAVGWQATGGINRVELGDIKVSVEGGIIRHLKFKKPQPQEPEELELSGPKLTEHNGFQADDIFGKNETELSTALSSEPDDTTLREAKVYIWLVGLSAEITIEPLDIELDLVGPLEPGPEEDWTFEQPLDVSDTPRAPLIGPPEFEQFSTEQPAVDWPETEQPIVEPPEMEQMIFGEETSPSVTFPDQIGVEEEPPEVKPSTPFQFAFVVANLRSDQVVVEGDARVTRKKRELLLETTWLPGEKKSLKLTYQPPVTELVVKSDFGDETIVCLLLEEKIITDDNKPPGYAYFANEIEDEYQLIQRLDRTGISEMEPVLTIWRNPPVPDFQFAVLGDTAGEARTFRKLLRRIEKEKPIFLAHCGDIVLTGKRKEYQGLLNSLTRLHSPIFLTPGNRDILWWGRVVFEELFGPTYYSFDYRNAHFVFLDNAGGRIDYQQMQWLEDDLSHNRRPYTFLFMHLPPFDPRPDKFSSMTSQPNADWLMHLATKYRVSRVFASHIQGYFRVERDGGIYIITAVGKKLPKRKAEGENKVEAEEEDVYSPHYLLINIGKEGITERVEHLETPPS